VVTWSTLKKRADFVAITTQGQSVVTKGVVLQYKQHDVDSDQDARVGFTATKRLGGAVVRNRVKRRLRAVAKDVLQTMGSNDFDYVLIGRYSTASRSYEQLTKDLKYAFHQVNEA
jgi:ribonuclease P protein component